VHAQSAVDKQKGGSAANRRTLDEGEGGNCLPLRLGVWMGDETSYYKALLHEDENMILRLLRNLTHELAA